MMELHCTGRTLRALDGTHGEVLVLGFYRDVRPFRGLLGQVDFRMLGRISKLAAKSFILGDLGETLLVPGRPRIPYDKILCVGLGASGAFDEQAFIGALRSIRSALQGLRVRRCTIELPGRAGERITPERAVDWLIAHPDGELPFEAVSFVEDADGERRMRERANDERRRRRQ
jgi:hypothetical protein